MKTREQVEEDYSKFESKNTYINNLDEFNIYLDILMDDRDEKIDDIEKEIKENHLYEFEARIRNALNIIFEEEEVEFYDEDNNILDMYISLEKVYKKYLEDVKFIARNYNYKRLLKFIDFMLEHYSERIEYIDYLRDQLEYKYKGAYFSNPKFDNIGIDVMIEFYYDKIKEFEEEFDRVENNDTKECIEIRKMKAKWK